MLSCGASLRTVVAGTIDTVPVGNAGNVGELSGSGAGGMGPDVIVGGVPYEYRVGTTEVTNGQYIDFLNAVAATDTYALFSQGMGANVIGGIVRSGSDGSYSYSAKAAAGDYTYADKPVVFVNWYQTLRFVNWLHNGKPSGLQDASTTEDGAYTFTALRSVGPRNPGATWWLPNEDEWYKAAYHKNDGATGNYWDYATATDTGPDNNLPLSDSGNSANYDSFFTGYTTGDPNHPMTPAGAYRLSASPYGTFDQSGNVWEWNENLVVGDSRSLRGGSFYAAQVDMRSSVRITGIRSHITGDNTGFRVASAAWNPDLNGDTWVDVLDVGVASENWKSGGAAGRTGDVNLDGRVDIFDVGVLSELWNPNQGEATAQSVPEPSTIALASLGLLAGLTLAVRQRIGAH